MRRDCACFRQHTQTASRAAGPAPRYYALGTAAAADACTRAQLSGSFKDFAIRHSAAEIQPPVAVGARRSHGNRTGRLLAYWTNSTPCSCSVSSTTFTLPV